MAEESITDSKPHLDKNFLRMLARMDEKIANGMLTHSIETQWTTRHGREHEEERLKVQSLSDDYDAAQTTVDKLSKQRSRTDDVVPSAEIHGERSRKDWLIIVLYGVGSIGAMALGAANLFAGMQSSGLPLMTENVWLCLGLSCLMPLSSLSLKAIGTTFLDSDHARKQYFRGLLAFLILALIAWTILFSINFPGLSGGVDLDAMLSMSSFGSPLVWCQLVVELLAGTSLAMAAEATYQRGSKLTYTDSPHRLVLDQRSERARAERDAVRGALADARGRLAVMDAQKALWLEVALGVLSAYRERIQAADNFEL